LSKGTLTARFLDGSEQGLRTIVRTVLAPLRSTGGYAKQKFPGLAAEEVEKLRYAIRRGSEGKRV